MKKKILALSALAFSMTAGADGIRVDFPPELLFPGQVKHVLLISVDGMHQVDLAKWVAANPKSTLAGLSGHGVTYTAARTTTPSDSFPGMTSFVTGASPKTTGIYYDDSYDRTYYAPGTNCTGNPGIEMLFDESIAYDDSKLFSGGINPANLPLQKDASGACKPVYPHDAIKVNTAFEVVKQHGGLTAWSDKHPAYDLLNGPSGEGIDDLYAPEINSLIANGGTANGVNLAATLAQCDGTNSLPVAKVSDYTTCIPSVEAYDDTHVQAAINWIDGLRSDGGPGLGVPTLFGFNMQQVSVAEKLPVGGYTDASGTPSANLAGVFAHVDQSLGRIVAELKKQRLDASTLIIISAKHGQSPIDRSTLAMEAGGSGNATVQDPSGFIAAADPTVDTPSSFTNPNSGSTLSTDGHLQTDDVGLVWLQNQASGNITNVVQQLRSNAHPMFADALPLGTIFATSINSGPGLAQVFGDPTDSTDPVASARAPNVFIQPNAGVIYSGSSKKIAEHGGGSQNDTEVALLVSMPSFRANTVSDPVSTRQVAPTILAALGINPQKLDGVRKEHTRVLPGLFLVSQED
ncbi:MAG: alkaline phosphatase family protein [Nevskia sp.]|nr:alkaline phosphatase family protein [Nevskia sp.]